MRIGVQPLRTGPALVTLLVGLVGSLSLSPGQASYLPSGRVVFDRSPQLVDIVALDSENPGHEQVQLVLTVPIDAGEPLEALLISPLSAEANVVFDPSATIATAGETPLEMAAVPLASVGGMPMQPNEVLVVFASPIEPGNQVTVLLTCKTRYLAEGYALGVTAYPAGDNPVGQFLGSEQVQF